MTDHLADRVCHEINDLLNSGNELAARNVLIKLLDEMNVEDSTYPPVLNQLIRDVGLYRKVIYVTKALAYNWDKELPELLDILSSHDIDIEEFFKLERTITFKLASLVGDANELHKIIVDPNADVSSFVRKLGHAFFLGSVYHLE